MARVATQNEVRYLKNLQEHSMDTSLVSNLSLEILAPIVGRPAKHEIPSFQLTQMLI